MPEERSFNFAMLSDPGRIRSGNEDFCAASLKIGAFVVCDGMGGAAAGEVASQLAATTFLAHLKSEPPAHGIIEARLLTAVRAANTAVYQHSQQGANLHGMGTTLVALYIEDKTEEQSHKLWLAHVGDSRCYLLRAGELNQLTQDHSLVQEQVLAGQLTPEQAERSPMRNIITRSIGSHTRVEPDICALDPQPGDLYLLASDGLTRELSDEALTALLSTAQPDLEATCRALIDAANAEGGHDNITVLLLQIH